MEHSHSIMLIDCLGPNDPLRQVSSSDRTVKGALYLVDATCSIAQMLSIPELTLESGLA